MDSDYSNIPQTVALRTISTNMLEDTQANSTTAKGTTVEHHHHHDDLKECCLLASLKHPNVAKLLGIIPKCGIESHLQVGSMSTCSILEHSNQGDLYHFLRQAPRGSKANKAGAGVAVINGTLNDTSSLSCSSSTSSTGVSSSASGAISYARLLDFTSQIANGMKYLEGRKIVHKDLAARNCILTENNSVKITDVAMGISLFNSDYSQVRGRRSAPIRWQPWETILLVSGKTF